MRIANTSATASSATPAPVGQQQSGSGASPFQQLLASATQNATPAANTGQSAAKPETAKTPANTATVSKQEDSQTQPVSNQAGIPAVSTNSNTVSATQQQPVEDTASTVASDEAAAQAGSQAANASLPGLLPQAGAPVATLKTVLADVAGQATVESSTTSVKTASGTTATGRTGGKQDKPQAVSISNHASIPVPATILPSNQVAAIPANILLPQRTTQQPNDGAPTTAKSSGSTTTVAAVETAAITHEIPQAAANTSNAQHAEAPVTPVKQPNPIVSTSNDADVQAVSSADAPAAANVNVQGQQSSAQAFTLPMNLPLSSTLPVPANAATAGNKTAAKDSISGTKNADPATSDDAAKNSLTASSASVATSSSTSTATQSGSQPVQHLQIDPSQATTVTAKAGDATAVQTQPAAMHTISPDTATTHRASDGLADTARSATATTDAAAARADVSEAASASGINTARVLQNMGETEMHVGMRSTEFGDISIRTSVSQQQMMAQISLDHGDLSQAIAAHVSTVQTKLSNEYGLHAQIEVSQQSSSFSGDSGQSSARDQRAYKSSNFIDGVSLPSADTDTAMTATLPVSSGENYRLDIRA